MTRALRSSLLLMVALAGVGCGGQKDDERFGSVDTAATPASGGDAAGGYRTVDVANGGTISGRVTLQGVVDTSGFQTPATQDVCVGALENNRVRRSADGAVADAVISLAAIKEGKAFAAAAPLLDQKGCQYLPHILPVRVGASVAIRNSDPVPHNVRIEDPATDSILFNIAQGETRVDSFTVAHAGPLVIRCDYHPWMNSYLYGVDNPYVAVTGADGRFSIDGVPPGRYTATIWFNGPRIRPKRDPAGKIVGYAFSDAIVETREVVVEAGRAASLDVALKGE